MTVWRTGELRTPGQHYDWTTEPTGTGFPTFRPPLLAGEYVEIARLGWRETHRAARNGQLPACCDCVLCGPALPRAVAAKRSKPKKRATKKPAPKKRVTKKRRKIPGTSVPAETTRARKTAKKRAGAKKEPKRRAKKKR